MDRHRKAGKLVAAMADLAPYAARDETTRGRAHPEPGPAYRGEYQRDRDRIIHCAAFRRLEYKTQVFVNHEGDMFRTRLTHSIEVAQIARTIARILNLNEDLTEAIALAHDLGHTPFGHAGQEVLDDCMGEYGGFEHNLQSLRVVDVLEHRYAAFPGLNLTFETREGILKHCTPERARAVGELGKRFLEGGFPSLEAQVTNLADAIAYNNHDVDDGLRSGLITLDDLREVEIFREHHAAVLERWPNLDARRVVHEVIRHMINTLVVDLVEFTGERIAALDPRHVDDVRGAPHRLVGFSEDVHRRHRDLKRFLREALYRHYRVRRMGRKASRILRSLFEAFMGDPRMLPPDQRSEVARLRRSDGEAGQARGVADYIAGMTDRYAITEFERMFNVSELT